MHRVPEDAFERYVSMGAERSYRALADELGFTKRAIQIRATRDGWNERMQMIQDEARERANKQLTETYEEIRVRHLKTLRALNARALEGLKNNSISSASDAMKAIEMVIKLERLILGDATERNAISIEDVVRRESKRWLTLEAEDATEIELLAERTDDEDLDDSTS